MSLAKNLIMSFKGAVDLYLVVLSLSLISTVFGREIQIKNDSEVKIIQATYNVDDDFNCVDMYKQPAFSHPLLRNHKIQAYPSFLKDFGRNNEVNSSTKAHIGFKGEGCPPGKVPIQRNKVNTNFHQFSNDYPGQHFAILRYGSNGIHGARAQINTYNPQVIDPQMSGAFIWVQGASEDSSKLNSIQVGWAVHPSIYNDTVTRLTALWTTNNYQTICYNYQCSGFVQVHEHYHLGQNVGNTSTYGGDQYEMDLMIKQDQSTGNWWLLLNDGLVQVGYWPYQLFPLLQNGATYLQYGGWVFASSDGNSPPMGSGQSPDQVYHKSCYFKNIKYVDSSFEEKNLYWLQIDSFIDTKTSCYDIKYWGDQGSNIGQTFSFGGPGGQCGT